MNDCIFIHPTAEVTDGAEIGEGTRIWQHCIVCNGAVVGAGCKLAHNVFIEGGVQVGDRVTVKDNVALYDGVSIADDVFIGPNAVFTNVASPRAFVDRKDEFVRTKIGTGASIGANATIVCGVSIGRYALIGAGCVVIRDVADHALVVGNPARQIGWVSRAGRKLGADLVCPETSEHYQETSDGLQAKEN
jgi:UDP-2-acetamido-3-amino-2,3-dideoxy-glucuronate N-acetyltransferase